LPNGDFLAFRKVNIIMDIIQSKAEKWTVELPGRWSLKHIMGDDNSFVNYRSTGHLILRLGAI